MWPSDIALLVLIYIAERLGFMHLEGKKWRRNEFFIEISVCTDTMNQLYILWFLDLQGRFPTVRDLTDKPVALSMKDHFGVESIDFDNYSLSFVGNENEQEQIIGAIMAMSGMFWNMFTHKITYVHVVHSLDLGYRINDVVIRIPRIFNDHSTIESIIGMLQLIRRITLNYHNVTAKDTENYHYTLCINGCDVLDINADLFTYYLCLETRHEYNVDNIDELFSVFEKLPIAIENQIHQNKPVQEIPETVANTDDLDAFHGSI